ncbi:MAG TPA: hypothetical protein VLV54_22015 [Thermoanaerobaculia bacterium]|nr:hypothetical protein [Thermoanaerobaculia bacterium]
MRSADGARRRDLLKKSFSQGCLGLKLLGGPIEPRSPSIFQMDIHQSPRFGEYFRIWPGARDTEIEVLSFDGSLRQLMLRVKEARRRFLQVVQKAPWLRQAEVEERARASGGRIVSETRYDFRLELWTPAEERRFLCGMDDLHLFVAQVQEGDTVAQAHKSLKPRSVREAETLWPGRIQRQGEWFFLPLSADEAERLAAHLGAWPRSMKHRRPVGPGGRPHVADGVVTIDRRIKTRHREWRHLEVYAQGTVIHPDHRDLHLDGWRKVVRNREVGATVDKRLWWID